MKFSRLIEGILMLPETLIGLLFIAFIILFTVIMGSISFIKFHDTDTHVREIHRKAMKYNDPVEFLRAEYGLLTYEYESIDLKTDRIHYLNKYLSKHAIYSSLNSEKFNTTLRDLYKEVGYKINNVYIDKLLFLKRIEKIDFQYTNW